MAFKVLDIQTLIAEGKIVNPSDIDIDNAYVALGLWQAGNRKSGSGNASYPQYVMKLSDLGAGGPGAQGPTGPAGPVGMTWRGGWSSLLNYSVRDVVYYNGSSYYCKVAIAASVNNPAATPANWDLVALKGIQGLQGDQGNPGPPGPVGPAGLNWQGLWSASGTYVLDDAVGYNGASWFCISPVGPTATTPDTDPTHWALLAAQGAPGDPGIQGIAGLDGDPGPQGPAGPANTLTIGTVNSGASPAASITGTAPNQILNLTLPVGPTGPAGAVTTLTVENGMRNIGTVTNPIIRLGGNPLIEDTEIATANFKLSVSGAGKFGVGLQMTAGATTQGKVQVRGTGSASNITGTISGTTFTVTNCATCPAIPGVAVYTGTINIGDYIFFSPGTTGAALYAVGAYILSGTGPVYTLSASPGNRTATGSQTDGGSPPVTIGNAAYFSTSQSLLRLETLGGVRALETWDNGTVKIGGVGGVGTTIFSDGNFMSVGYAAPPMVSNVNFATPGIYTNYINLGGLGSGGSIQFNSNGNAIISSPAGTLDMNYSASASGSIGNRFIGKMGISPFSDNFQFPSVYGGASSTTGYGARPNYAVSVYKTAQDSSYGAFNGYISGTRLYIRGCAPLDTFAPSVGQTIGGKSGYLTGVPENTVISSVVTPYIAGPAPAPGNPCVTTQEGVYELETNGVAYAGPNIGSAGGTIRMYSTNYPAWTNTRAMYIDGTITFKNLPQGAGSAPVLVPPLVSGDIWHDTVDNTIKIVP